ncbi:M10 family metallopeptidase C-terminal domain-containing protein [Methylobacterium symbioticum]|uniref:M10 family metallopeptidase C-terminal domain-containing protein n=1 Tax=Methylobacterium symbioticum TaxID=2584084 RepID=UPI00115B1770|nr:M10 family metallopeptidase C-terminal domain-containing protein [Methylobacterium symbioticum]
MGVVMVSNRRIGALHHDEADVLEFYPYGSGEDAGSHWTIGPILHGIRSAGADFDVAALLTAAAAHPDSVAHDSVVPVIPAPVSDHETFLSYGVDALSEPDAAPTQSLTRAQAGAQITRGNYHWGSGALGTAAGPITFGFRTSAPTYSVANHGDVIATFTPFTTAQQDAARAALAQWASIANITFVDQGNTNSATIEFGNYSYNGDGSQAFAYYPGDTSASAAPGDVFFNTYFSGTSNFGPGSYNYMTMIHEIGHAIGLQHPGDYNASGSSTITYDNSAQYIQDTRMYSIMSYFSESFTGGSFTGYDETPMMDDIAAVQRLYGANTNTRTGDTIYGFHSNAGSPFSIATSSDHVVFTVYDRGGVDTLDFSGYAQNQLINLNPESFSNIGGDTGNVSIASGVSIERAIGGSGNDTFILNNSLFSTVTGGLGADTFRASMFGWSGSSITDLGLSDQINVTDASLSTFSYSWSGTSLTLQNGSTSNVMSLSNNPVGHLILKADPSGGVDLVLAPTNLQLSDFNHDGRSDLLWRNSDGAVIEWDLGANGTSPTSSGLIGSDPNWSVVGTGDFTNDHASDILWRNAITGNVVQWTMNDRTVTASAYIGGDTDWSVVGTGDFNGDGRTDLLWRQSSSGALFEWLIGTNGTSPQSSGILGNDPNYTVVGTGDFNGDGYTDILQRNNVTGQVVETRMVAGNNAGNTFIGGDLQWSVAGTGDFNADGRTDLLWHNANGALFVWLMGPDGVTPQLSGILGNDPNYSVLRTGDFNVDGYSDILQRNNVTGQVLEWTFTGNASVASSTFIGGDHNWSIVPV